MNIRCLVIVLLTIFFSCKEKQKNNTNKNLLEEIKLYKRSDKSKALILSDSLIKFAKKNKDTLTIFEGYLQKGLLIMHLGDGEEAISIFKSQLPLLSTEKYCRMKSRYLIGMGNVYVMHGDNFKAMKFYEEAVEIIKKKDYKKLFFIAEVNLAKVKRNIGDKEEALAIYKKYYAEKDIWKIDSDNEARVLMGIGGTFLTLHQPDSALYYSNIGLKIAEGLKNKTLKSYFYHDMGIAHVQKKEPQQALTYLNKSRSYIEFIKNNERLAESLFYIGKSYYGLQNYEQAAEYLEKVILIVDTSEKRSILKFRPQELIDTYDLLIKSYQKLNKDAEFIAFVIANKNELSKEIETNHNKVKITLYKKQNQALAVILKQKNKEAKSQKTLLIIIFGFLVISILALIYYKNKSKNDKKKFQALMRKQEQVNTLEKNISKEINIKDDKVAEILKRLQKIEKQEYYLDQNCSLANMAKKTKTNTTYLTKILKEHKEKTFYQYLNELRINYAIDRLQKDKQFQKYAIKHIAMEVGYKSPESFTKHFKKATGIYPSYYIKNITKL